MVNNAVSLFAGIGGFELAMRNVGIPTIASCEIDPKAQQVLKTHFPNTHIFDDIQTLNGKDLINAGFKPKTGIITAGFPCQDLSVAGKRAGLNGQRSGLFWHIVRLLEQTQTEWFLLENVPGLLTSNNGRDFGTALRALVECGYSVGWRVLDAQYFGVPQRRRRIFILGNRSGNGEHIAQILFKSEGLRRDITQSQEQGQSVTGNVGEGFGQSMLANGKEISNCLPAELYHHGTVVNQDVDNGHLIVFKPHQTEGARIQTNVINTLTASMGTGGNNVPMLTYAFDEYNNSIANNHHTLRAGTKQSTGVLQNQVRRLTPIECERLQGFPDNWTTNQPDSHRYKQLGNAIAVPCVQWIMQGIITIG
jgi:DNA (cytosine-5)-methyltransferase 1